MLQLLKRHYIANFFKQSFWNDAQKLELPVMQSENFERCERKLKLFACASVTFSSCKRRRRGISLCMDETHLKGRIIDVEMHVEILLKGELLQGQYLLLIG